MAQFRFDRALIVCLALALTFLSHSSTTVAKSRRPISSTEVNQRKQDCYADVESGLWGWECTASMTAKENCALRCLSPHCYELIYESDPLEEGEKDFARSSEYKYCMTNYYPEKEKCDARECICI